MRAPVKQQFGASLLAAWCMDSCKDVFFACEPREPPNAGACKIG